MIVGVNNELQPDDLEEDCESLEEEFDENLSYPAKNSIP
jgi:hypothetical protein